MTRNEDSLSVSSAPSDKGRPPLKTWIEFGNMQTYLRWPWLRTFPTDYTGIKHQDGKNNQAIRICLWFKSLLWIWEYFTNYSSGIPRFATESILRGTSRSLPQTLFALGIIEAFLVPCTSYRLIGQWSRWQNVLICCWVIFPEEVLERLVALIHFESSPNDIDCYSSSCVSTIRFFLVDIVTFFSFYRSTLRQLVSR